MLLIDEVGTDLAISTGRALGNAETEYLPQDLITWYVGMFIDTRKLQDNRWTPRTAAFTQHLGKRTIKHVIQSHLQTIL